MVKEKRADMQSSAADTNSDKAYNSDLDCVIACGANKCKYAKEGAERGVF